MFVLNNIHNQLESTLEMNTDVEVLSNTREGKRINTLSHLFNNNYQITHLDDLHSFVIFSIDLGSQEGMESLDVQGSSEIDFSSLSTG